MFQSAKGYECKQEEKECDSWHSVTEAEIARGVSNCLYLWKLAFFLCYFPWREENPVLINVFESIWKTHSALDHIFLQLVSSKLFLKSFLRMTGLGTDRGDPLHSRHLSRWRVAHRWKNLSLTLAGVNEGNFAGISPRPSHIKKYNKRTAQNKHLWTKFICNIEGCWS